MEYNNAIINDTITKYNKRWPDKITRNEDTDVMESTIRNM